MIQLLHYFLQLKVTQEQGAALKIHKILNKVGNMFVQVFTKHQQLTWKKNAVLN